MNTTISALVKALQKQRDNVQGELDRLDTALAALQGLSGSKAPKTVGRPAGKRRKMSAAARAKIGAAQRARWAKQKTALKPAKKKRKMSAAGRAAIIAGVKARWAKVRAEKEAQAKA